MQYQCFCKLVAKPVASPAVQDMIATGPRAFSPLSSYEPSYLIGKVKSQCGWHEFCLLVGCFSSPFPAAGPGYHFDVHAVSFVASGILQLFQLAHLCRWCGKPSDSLVWKVSMLSLGSMCCGS